MTERIEIGRRKLSIGDLPDLVFDPQDREENRLGISIRIGGDVNGDGYLDILIGAVGWQNARGCAYLYFGGPNTDNQADMVFTGEHASDRFSGQSGAFGDLNHDGYDDVIIGAWAHPKGKNDGRVYVYYGGPNIDNVPDMLLDGEAGQGSMFGLPVMTSDIDRDGYTDLLVGAQNYDHGGEYQPSYTHEFGPIGGRGRVYLYWGGDQMDTTSDVILEGERRHDWFGRRISANGDVNNDGFNDILIGARHAGGRSRGRAYLFFGGTKEKMDSECDWTFTGEAYNDQLGSSVTIFDIDNDGLGDVLVNARYADGFNGGRVYIYWGDTEFDGSRADVTLKGDGAMAEIACGYFNGDSYADILAGCWQYRNRTGRARLFYGQSKENMDTGCDHVFFGRDGTQAVFGNQVCAGDVNADGYADALIAASTANDRAGRAYLYYGPFDGAKHITFNWDTTKASIGKHTLKVEIPPVPGEQKIEDNVKTVTIEVKEPRR